VQTLHHDALFQALYERSCDVAIAYDPPTHPRMKRRDIDSGELMLLFRNDVLPDAGEHVPLRILDGQNLVGLTTGGPVGDLLNRELQRQDIAANEVVSNQTFYIAAELARHGVGMAVVDEFTARASSGPSLSHRPFSPPLRFKVQYVHLEDRPPSEAVRRFLTVFARTLRDARAGGAGG